MTFATPLKKVLMDRASSSCTVERDHGQIVVRCDGERSGKLTLWLRGWGAGDRNVQGIDGESPEEEEGESSFEEYHDMERLEEEQITMAPGLKFGRYERRTGVSCTAAGETGEYISTLL